MEVLLSVHVGPFIFPPQEEKIPSKLHLTLLFLNPRANKLSSKPPGLGAWEEVRKALVVSIFVKQLFMNSSVMHVPKTIFISFIFPAALPVKYRITAA